MTSMITRGVLEAPRASYWQAATPRAVVVSAGLPDDCDVVIVGGGLAGLSTAIAIMERSPFARVSVLEAHFVGYGASGRAGGLISPLAAPVWLASAQRNGDHAWALGYLRALVDDTASWIKALIPESEIKSETLTLESTGALSGLGLEALSGILGARQINHRVGVERSGCAGLSLPCHTVNPFGLVQGLARHARALGVSIYEGVVVTRIDDTEQGAYLTLAGGHSLIADTVVVCTNAYTDGVAMARAARGKVVSNYMVATRRLPAETQAIIGKSGRFTVELNGAYVYYRLHEGRLLFGGIEKLGRPGGGGYHVPAEVLATLNGLMQRSFPGIEALEIDCAWGGQFHMTATDLPDIRRVPRAAGDGSEGSVVMNVGYGGTGIALTLAMSAKVAALALRQAAVEPEDDRLAEIMAATRVPIRDLAVHAARIGWSFVRKVLGTRAKDSVRRVGARGQDLPALS